MNFFLKKNGISVKSNFFHKYFLLENTKIHLLLLTRKKPIEILVRSSFPTKKREQLMELIFT